MTDNANHWVLVVDDDSHVRETMVELLRDSGHQVLCAENGAEALQVLRDSLAAARDICVVLLDLTMPVMDGWTFRKQQLADAALANIPVVVITAASADFAELGAVSILRKPLAMDTIIDQVQAHCG